MNNKLFVLVVVGLVLVGLCFDEASAATAGTTVAQCKTSQNELFVNPTIATKQSHYHNLILNKCISKILSGNDLTVSCDFTNTDDVEIERAMSAYLSSCTSSRNQANIVVTSVATFHHNRKNIQATISWFQCISSSCSVETHLPYIVASRVREVSFGASVFTSPEGYSVDYVGGLKFKISSAPANYPYYPYGSSSYPYGYSSSSSDPYGYSSSSSYPYGYSSSSSYPYGYSSSSSYYGYSSSSSYYGYSSSSSYYGYSSSSSYPYGYSSSSSYPYGYSSSSSYPYGYSSSSSYPYGYSSSSSNPYGYSSSSYDPYGYSSSSSYYGAEEDHNDKHNKDHKKDHNKDEKGHNKNHKNKHTHDNEEDIYSFDYARKFIPFVIFSMLLVVVMWAIIRRRQANQKYQFLEPGVCQKV